MLSPFLVIIIRSLMLWSSTSSSWSKLIVQIQLTLHPCDPSLINNCNMTGISIDKHCYIVLNVKLQVKLRFKTFYWLLKLLPTALALSTGSNTACFAWNFCMFEWNLRNRTGSQKRCISFRVIKCYVNNTLEWNYVKAGFPLVDFFRTNGLFSPLIHHITQ